MDSDYKITTVTAYDVSGDKPKEQWSADPRTDSFYLFYWGDYVVAGDMLIKADTGKTTDAPWTETNLLPFFTTSPLKNPYPLVVAPPSGKYPLITSFNSLDRKSVV